MAAELGVADQLTAGGRPVEELAEACGAEADGLFRLLRGLASGQTPRPWPPGVREWLP